MGRTAGEHDCERRERIPHRRYSDEEAAKTILSTLHDMHRGLTISLKGSAIGSRGDDGKSRLHGGLGDKIGSLLENVRDTGIKK